jgi:uncharacterized damage-inducible protein DinB
MDRNALLEHYRHMRAALLEAIDGIPDDRIIEKTLDGWSVKDHLAHIAAWDEIRAAEVVRASAGFETAWHMPGRDQIFSNLVHEIRQPHSIEQVRWELQHTHDDLLEAIANATTRGLEPDHYGEAGLLSTHEARHTDWLKRWRSEQQI